MSITMVQRLFAGGDRAKLLREADASNVYAVIAPNMGKQIVAFQVCVCVVCGVFLF